MHMLLYSTGQYVETLSNSHECSCVCKNSLTGCYSVATILTYLSSVKQGVVLRESSWSTLVLALNKKELHFIIYH